MAKSEDRPSAGSVVSWPPMNPDLPHRRDFIRVASSGALSLSAASFSRLAGANDRIRLGVIGCGGRGRGVMGSFQQNAAVEIAAVCDIYGARVDEAQQKAPGARGFRDHRALLDQRDVDAVLIATPDHWHSDIVVDAAAAGKDIYVEKPLTLTIEEGPRVVKAVRVSDRVCQVGMQQR
jgi:predicted dehydrogenase